MSTTQKRRGALIPVRRKLKERGPSEYICPPFPNQSWFREQCTWLLGLQFHGENEVSTGPFVSVMHMTLTWAAPLSLISSPYLSTPDSLDCILSKRKAHENFPQAHLSEELRLGCREGESGRCPAMVPVVGLLHPPPGALAR